MLRGLRIGGVVKDWLSNNVGEPLVGALFRVVFALLSIQTFLIMIFFLNLAEFVVK